MKKKSIRQKKITRRKNNKKTKKNKTIIGGLRPKINFPYTYFIIDYNTFGQYPELKFYLNQQTNACNNASLGNNNPEVNNLGYEFLNNINEICIIVLKYDDVSILNNNKNNNLLKDFNFLNKILGHAKLIHYKDESLVGIYNVCLHIYDIFRNQQDFRNQQYDFIFKPKIRKPGSGYGTVLFNCIYTGIFSSKINFNKIWLGIDINNVEFKKVAWLYTSKGFSNPIYSNITPDGNEGAIYFIELTNNKRYVNNKDDALIPYHETIDLYYQIKSFPDSKGGIFSFKFSFDKTAILSLRLMPFLSFSENKDVLGIEDFSKQRETAGRFLIYKTNDNENSVSYVLSLETMSQQSIKYTIGKSDSVEVIEGERVFHTHPYLNYYKNQTFIGPPSGQDFIAFLNLMTQPKQFSCIISIEGIYIFSLSIQGIIKLIYNEFPRIDHLSYEYPFINRFYDWNNYANDPDIQVNAVENAVKNYLKWFKELPNNLGILFNINFIPWNQLGENTNVEIYYYNGNRLKVKQF
jgi:hypothetical protein